MKTRSFIAAVAFMGVCSFTLNSYAHDHPKGMAVDANGNLYVANVGNTYPSGGGVAVYSFNNNYAPTTSYFSAGLRPTGVAFNSFGDMYVSNSADSTVTVYSSRFGTRSLLSGLTITEQVKIPQGIAVDGFDNIWVLNTDSSVITYGLDHRFIHSGVTPNLALSLAAKGAFVTIGQEDRTEMLFSSDIIANDIRRGIFRFYDYGGTNPSQEANAVAFDSEGNQYLGLSDNTLMRCPSVYKQSYKQGTLGYMLCTKLVTTNYLVDGIVVDLKRDRMYTSNSVGNIVDVRHADGSFIATIH